MSTRVSNSDLLTTDIVFHIDSVESSALSLSTTTTGEVFALDTLVTRVSSSTTHTLETDVSGDKGVLQHDTHTRDRRVW